ncbi:organic cation transporter protein [Bacillus rossius redtenbacheri]|uniref:organic cation transporter protein n=1 Tax=Bacillus rossius redtenbacheri TaxID=93214 RepID=UPI002FDCAC74
MDFDEVLDEIGEFGRFQIINYFLICLPVMFGAANSLSYVFTAGVPDYRCAVPGCDDPAAPDFSPAWLPRAVPPADPRPGAAYSPAACLRYLPLRNLSAAPAGCGAAAFSEAAVRCDAWLFRDERTIVNDWNITCADNQWKLSMVGTVHFAGILVGAFSFGFLADRFGRKIVFVFCILLMSVSGVAQAVSPDYATFQVFVFINALGTSGVYPLAFIIGVELVGKNKREMSGIVLNYFYAVGEAMVGLVAWMARDWVVLQLVLSAPPLLFVLYFWFVPESVRWLLTNKKNKEASSIITKAAKTNGVKLSERLLSKFDISNEEEYVGGRTFPTKVKQVLGIWESICLICKNKKLLLRSFLLFYVWIANAFVYYGLSVNSTVIGGNKYVNFTLVCLVEIPGYSLAWYAMNRFGRRKALCGSFMLCSGTCLAAGFVPPDTVWAVVTLFLIGKIGITSSFGIIFVYTAELYPTVMRSAGVGASSTVARVGAMVAPFAPLLDVHMKALPFLLFGGVALLAAFVSFFFPETLGRKLPDTIEEVDKLS